MRAQGVKHPFRGAKCPDHNRGKICERPLWIERREVRVHQNAEIEPIVEAGG